MKEVVLITGASAGIGESLANLLASKGYVVYGLSRRVVENSNYKNISVDVTNYENVKKVVDEIYKEEGRIDILINNAGMGISGSIEKTSSEDMDQIIDVNIKGVQYMTSSVLPYMRKNKKGKIINISSVAGELSIPFQAFYSATKSFIKSYSEALHTEVIPYNIQVSTIYPGDIKTDFTKNRKKNKEEDQVYIKRVQKSISVMEKDEQNGMPRSYAAKVIYKVLKKKKMPIRKTIGFKYKIFLFLNKILPTKLVQKVIGGLYGFKKD